MSLSSLSNRRRALRAARMALPVALVLGLAACASSGGKREVPAEAYGRLISEGDAQLANGAFDSALQAYQKAALADPTRKEPWVKSSQLYFDSGNYGRAIASAEEVLQRDPADTTADSILTVGGLRIAVQSLHRLQEGGALSTEAARFEAEQLATALRSTLGDSILAPAPGARSRRGSTAASRPQAAQPQPQPQRETRQETPPADNANPFRHLRPGGN